MSPEWMDAVCIKGEWDVIIAKADSGQPEGVLVYHYRKILSQQFILMPPMCFYNGIYLLYKENMSTSQKISFDNKVSVKLISELPSFAFYYQQYHPEYNNWSSLYWKGFKQTTRYTYRLEANQNKEVLWSKLKPNLKRNINKAEKSCIIKSANFNDFWNALSLSYNKRENPFNKELLSRICSSLPDASQLFLCYDIASNNILAGSIIVSDKNSSYYLCGFYNPQGKESGGLSYLLWQNILNNSNNNFDFEGSMIKEIEYFFRSFGADWTPHYRIWKINSFLLSGLIKWKFKNILNG
jgi:hypothetical protein